METQTFQLEELPFGEIDRIEPLWHALIQSNAEHSPYFRHYYDGFSFPIRKGFLEQKQLDGGFVVTWIATAEGGKDVGFCTVSYGPAAEGGLHGGSRSGEIEMLYVDPSLRGHGLGSRMLQTALDHLEAQGVGDLKLCVTYGNEDALRLYQRFGFYPFTIDCLKK